MIYEFNQNISKLDEIKTEAQVLIPVLKAARAELGEENANSLIYGALRGWCCQRFKQIGSGIPGTAKEKWETIKNLDNLRIRENDLQFEILRWDLDAIEYDVSHCAYADFFREQGEPELGVILVCDSDIYLVEEVTGPEVEYKRSQTIMEGATFCDIRWRVKTNTTPK